MKDIDIEMSIRITEVNDDFVHRYSSVSVPNLDRGMYHADRSILIIPIQPGDLDSAEQALDVGLSSLNGLKEQCPWPTGAFVSLWVTISTSGEFVGLVVSQLISDRASGLGADLVISVYCRQTA